MSEGLCLAVLSATVSRNAGGLFTSVRKLTQNVAECPGCEARVFAFKDKHTAADLALWLPIEPRTFAKRGLGFFPVSAALRQAVLAYQPGLIHTHGIWMYPSMVDLDARRRGIPYVVSPRGMLDPWALTNSRWKKRLAGWLFENRHLRNAACLHALCRSEAESMRACGLRNPIAVIPNGIDVPGPPVDSDLRNPAAKRGHIKQLLFLGRIHPKKGISHLLAAWRREREHLAKWEVVIAGWSQGGHEEELKRQVAESGTGDSVRFIGPKFGEEKDRLLRQVDAFILPSFSEGLPMSVLEAWAYGLPVLMTPECNLPEGFAAEAAIRIETDPESIATGLRTLAALNEAGLRGLGTRGRTLVSNLFTWPKIAADMMAVYQWILGRSEQPECVYLHARGKE